MTSEAPDSDPSADASSRDADDQCTNCGEPVETDEWHPVRTRDEDGSVTVYTFCSQACRDEWSP